MGTATRLGVSAPFIARSIAAAKPGSARSIIASFAVSEIRKWPGISAIVPGSTKTPYFANTSVNARSSSHGERAEPARRHGDILGFEGDADPRAQRGRDDRARFRLAVLVGEPVLVARDDGALQRIHSLSILTDTKNPRDGERHGDW